MSARRDEILRELGLSPQWQRRGQPQHESVAEFAQPELVTESSTAQQTAVASALSSSSTSSSKPHAVSASKSQSPATAILPEDERAIEIMRMDWTPLKECVADCVACPLHKGRTKTVFGVGDEHAEWMFVGEGPGAEEDLKGEPFVGQAGKLLDNMLKAIALKRGSNVYIANIVKCRPPGNRNPEPGEAAQCRPYLQRQIDLIKPKLIIALGKVAAVNLLQRDASIASMRGTVNMTAGVPMIVTYHPAYLLRSLPDKAKAWEDLCFAVETMKDLRDRASAPA